MQASIFDTQKTSAYYKIHPEENPLLEGTTKNPENQGTNNEGNATNTKNTFGDISNEIVENMIPREEEIKAATDFVKRLIKE